MDKALDMSLDDIIKSKKTVGAGRGRGRGGAPGGGAPRGRGGRGSFGGGKMRGMGRGPARQISLGVNVRSSSLSIAKSIRRTKNFPWQHDLLEESLAAAGLPGLESGTKLFISNLERGVSNDDIRELFTEIGELKRYAIHYDKNGCPSGSAEVVYAKRSDAFAAHKRYNNVQLDGRPMKIEIVSPGSEMPVSARVNVVGGTNGRATRRVVLTPSGGRQMFPAPTHRGFGQRRGGGGLRNGTGGRGQTRSQSQSRGGMSGRGRGRGRGGGRGRGKKQDKSAEDLDKELEHYHADGMQIS